MKRTIPMNIRIFNATKKSPFYTEEVIIVDVNGYFVIITPERFSRIYNLQILK